MGAILVLIKSESWDRVRVMSEARDFSCSSSDLDSVPDSADSRRDDVDWRWWSVLPPDEVRSLSVPVVSLCAS